MKSLWISSHFATGNYTQRLDIVQKVFLSVFFTKWCSFGYSCIDRTGTGYTEEARFKFLITNFAAWSVVVLMIAKEIASPPVFILLAEGAPSKGLMIVAITDQIIWLFVVNDVDKLIGFIFEFNLFCDVFIKFLSEQTFWSVFLDYVFYFLTSYLLPFFTTYYCHQGISASVIRQRIKCLPYHVVDMFMMQRQCFAVINIFCNIFWNVALILRNLFMRVTFFSTSRKSHICDRGPKMFPNFYCIGQKTLSNDKVSLAFFSYRRNFILKSTSFLQVRFSGIGNSAIFVPLYHYQVWNSSFVAKHILQGSHLCSMS